MKFALALAAIVSIGLNTAHAADRRAVDQNVFDLVRTNVKLEEFRVYISKKVKINRQSSLSTQDTIGADISRERLQKIQKETLKNDVRGKIIAVVNNENFSKPLIYVSFDKSCTSKECSYGFTMLDGNIAKLVLVPNYGMDQITVKSKKKLAYHTWLISNDRQVKGHTLLIADDNSSIKNRPILEYKLSENDSTVRDEIRNRGW